MFEEVSGAKKKRNGEKIKTKGERRLHLIDYKKRLVVLDVISIFRFCRRKDREFVGVFLEEFLVLFVG